MTLYVNRFHIGSAILFLKSIFSNRIIWDIVSKTTRINKIQMWFYANDYNIFWCEFANLNISSGLLIWFWGAEKEVGDIYHNHFNQFNMDISP